MRDLNAYAKRVHELNKNWWIDLETGESILRDKFELLALVISELSEALEGERKDLMDDHLTHRKMAEVEMADTVIRLLDFAGGFGYILLPQKVPQGVSENKAAAIFHFMAQVVELRDPANTYKIGYIIGHIGNYCDKHGYDLWRAVNEKLEYNKTRVDHQPSNRKLQGGKKF